MKHERREDYPQILEKIKIIEETLIGNGEPGLKERMRTVESFVTELKAFHKQIQKVIIGAAGTIVTTIIIAMFLYFLIPTR